MTMKPPGSELEIGLHFFEVGETPMNELPLPESLEDVEDFIQKSLDSMFLNQKLTSTVIDNVRVAIEGLLARLRSRFDLEHRDFWKIDVAKGEWQDLSIKIYPSILKHPPALSYDKRGDYITAEYQGHIIRGPSVFEALLGLGRLIEIREGRRHG